MDLIRRHWFVSVAKLLFRDQSVITSPHFSPGFVARRRRRAWMQGARREDSAGVLDSTSRSPTERNAADMPGSAAAVETW